MSTTTASETSICQFQYVLCNVMKCLWVAACTEVCFSSFMLCRGWGGQRPCLTVWSVWSSKNYCSNAVIIFAVRAETSTPFHFFFPAAFCLLKVFENGFVACCKHFLCPDIFYQMVYCLIQYFFARVCIMKCFTNNSRHFQFFVMFCLWMLPCLQPWSFCTTDGSNVLETFMILTRVFQGKLA